jgi:hypothetical protein
MKQQEFWIAQGRLVPSPLEDDRSTQLATDRLHRFGEVRISVREAEILIEWCVFAPNWASLQVVKEWILALRGPFKLRYFLAGWFEETIPNPLRARDRIDRIQAKSDLHVTQRAFVRKSNPRAGRTPPLLYDAWRHRLASPEHTVDCVLDEQTGRFRVERIGQFSTIARLWGTAPISYPCINGGPYDRIVSMAYGEVARTGAPRFDHVYAAMTLNGEEQVWIPYQRVILPYAVPSGRPAVSVVTEIASVDIQIV